MCRAEPVGLVQSICRRLVRWIDNGITLVLVSRVRLRHGCGVTEPFVPLSLVLGGRRPRMWSGCCLKPWTSVSLVALASGPRMTTNRIL